MRKPTLNQTPPSTAAIAEQAYWFWEQAGRPAGRDQEFWLRAEAALALPANASEVPPVIPPPPIPTAAPAHQVPPPIKAAVTTAGRRPSRQRVPKRA